MWREMITLSESGLEWRPFKGEQNVIVPIKGNFQEVRFKNWSCKRKKIGQRFIFPSPSIGKTRFFRVSEGRRLMSSQRASSKPVSLLYFFGLAFILLLACVFCCCCTWDLLERASSEHDNISYFFCSQKTTRDALRNASFREEKNGFSKSAISGHAPFLTRSKNCLKSWQCFLALFVFQSGKKKEKLWLSSPRKSTFLPFLPGVTNWIITCPCSYAHTHCEIPGIHCVLSSSRLREKGKKKSNVCFPHSKAIPLSFIFRLLKKCHHSICQDERAHKKDLLSHRFFVRGNE